MKVLWIAFLSFALPLAVLADQQRVVAIQADGSAVAAEALGENSKLRAVWIWSDQSAPRRYEVAHWPVALDTSDQRTICEEIEVREPTGAVRVVAAPLKMWMEVPKSLLPQWPVSARENRTFARICHGEGNYRLEASTSSQSSGWIDSRGQFPQVLELLPARLLRQTVRGSEGESLESARLTLRERAGATERFLEFHTLEGSDQHTLLAPSAADLSLMVTSSDFLPAIVSAQKDSEIELTRGFHLSGRIVDEDGAAVAGALIRVETWHDVRTPLLLVEEAISSETGTFSVGPLSTREWRVSVSHAEFARSSSVVPASEGNRSAGNIILHPRQSVRIIVVDESGRAIPAAEVIVDGAPAGRTDDRGALTVADFPRDAARLRVSAPKHLTLEENFGPSIEEEIEVTLIRSVILTGRIVCAGLSATTAAIEVKRGNQLSLHEVNSSALAEVAAGEPGDLTISAPGCLSRSLPLPATEPGDVIDLGQVSLDSGWRIRGQLLGREGALAGARVWALRPSQQGPLYAWRAGEVAETTSDADGMFVLSGLPRRPTQIHVDHPGYARSSVRISPSEGSLETDTGIINLVEGTTVVVRVDADEASAVIDLGMQWLDYEYLRAPVKDGEARIPNVPSGNVRLWVQREGTSFCEQELVMRNEEHETTIDCDDDVTRVRGVVRIGHDEVSGGALLWTREVKRPQGVIVNSRSPQGSRRQETLGRGPSDVYVTCDEDGRFETDRLVPGAWSVRYIGEAGETAAQNVQVARDGARNLNLEWPERNVTGIVLDSNGGPVARARVTEALSGKSTISGSDGRFQMIGLEHHTARLAAESREGASEPVEVALDENADEVVLVVKPKETVSLRLVGPDGNGIAGGLIFVENDRGRISLVAADSRGRVTWRRPPFVQRIRMAGYDFRSWCLGEWYELTEDREITCTVGSTGTLVIEGQGTTVTSLTSGTGWQLLTLLGLAGTGGGTRFDGLPDGMWTVGAGEEIRLVHLEGGRTRSVDFQ